MFNYLDKLNGEVPKDKKLHSYVRRDFNIVICLMFMIFLLVAFFSVIYAIKRLIRKGVTTYAR